ncbi:hypothetical protein ACOSQ3_001207 [Xanthoceras sorbifolium]
MSIYENKIYSSRNSPATISGQVIGIMFAGFTLRLGCDLHRFVATPHFLVFVIYDVCCVVGFLVYPC